jgi:hypothetical protein
MILDQTTYHDSLSSTPQTLYQVQRHVSHENEYITPYPQILLQIVVEHPTMFEVRL